jgi:hypothetical protein
MVEKTWRNHWFYWYLMGIYNDIYIYIYKDIYIYIMIYNDIYMIYDIWEYLMVISGYCWFKWILHGYLSKDRRGSWNVDTADTSKSAIVFVIFHCKSSSYCGTPPLWKPQCYPRIN